MDDLTKPEYFLNRELSWMEFNRRVLEEAQDEHQPLLERVKFLVIVSSNLDEFFEIRVAGIKQQIESGVNDTGPDGLTPTQVFDGIRQRVLTMVAEQHRLWSGELAPALAKHNIKIKEMDELNAEERKWTGGYFRSEVFPVLTPLAVDSSHPFPQLRNRSHNLIILMQRPDQAHGLSYGIVQIPRVLPRLVRLPSPGHENSVFHYTFLKDLIQCHVSDLFPGVQVKASYGFRITRNSDLYFDEEESENLLRAIEDELRKRSRGNAVRLEVQHDCPTEIQAALLDILKLNPQDLYLIPGPLNFAHIQPLCGIDGFSQLRDRPWVPVPPKDLPPDSDVFEVMRRRDILIHHPYESFNSVVDFVHRVAEDPQVLAIKMTLYRTSGDSPIVRGLIEAARNGKQVTALVELRARFDEANNINWARQLEDAGVHVVYGVVGLKTHCKLLMVVRRDEDRIRHYVHLGTGNYHPSTARIYTDLSLLTTHTELTEEVAALFNTLTGLSEYQGDQLLVAPFELAERFHQLIDAERDLAKAGKPAHIIAKVNSLVDEAIIERLYEASRAGVKVDLIVRGVCCLRPGIPGVSENIRVISIVGRFLEHSRIYFFANNGDPKVYLGSADWMPRNLYRRVEVVFPILAPHIKSRVIDNIIPTFLKDCVKARELKAEGTYVRLQPVSGQTPHQAQLAFREQARASARGLGSQGDRRVVPIHGDPRRSVPPSKAAKEPPAEKPKEKDSSKPASVASAKSPKGDPTPAPSEKP
jgi:polyphosphate kinase